MQTIEALITSYTETLRAGDYWQAYLLLCDHRYYSDATPETSHRLCQLALAACIRAVLDYLHEDLDALGHENEPGPMPEEGHIAYALNLLRAVMPVLPERFRVVDTTAESCDSLFINRPRTP